MESGPPTRVKNATAKSPAELLGYLQQISRDAADGNAAQVLDAVVRLPVECLGAAKSILLQASSDGGPCLPIVSRNLSWGLPADCSSSDGCIVRKAIIEQTPQIADHLCDPLCACADIVGQAGDQLLACIPVVAGTGSDAALLCTRSQNQPLRVWEIEFLNILANHAASALQHRSQNRQSVALDIQTLERVQDIMLSSDGLQDILDGLLPAALDMLQADTGSVILCEDDRHRVVSHVGLPVGVEHEHHRSKSGMVSARVLVDKRPLLLHGPPDARTYPGATPRHDVGSAIVTPLLSNRKPIGLLCANRKHQVRQFSTNELVFAGTIAQFISMAIDNARLYDMVRSQTRHFGNLYQVAKSVTADLQIDSLLKIITRRLKALMDCDACALFLRDNRANRLDMVSGHIISGEGTEYAELAEAISDMVPPSKHVLSVTDLGSNRESVIAELADRLGLRSAVLATFRTKRKRSGAIGVFSRKVGAFGRQDTGLVLGLAELAGIAIENAWLYEQTAIMANITEKELMPQTPAPIPGFEIGCKYAPAFRVGGDYFDIIRINDHQYGLAIIDVAGKDVAASVHVAMCKYALRALGRCITTPACFMQEMNRFIHEHMEQDKFVSMMYAVIDTESGEITYSSAGHEPALLYRHHSREVEQLRTPGILLGVKSDATFTEEHTSIEAGDVVLLYTDGLLEALAPDGLDATTKLETMLAGMGTKHPQEIADNMHVAAAHSESGHAPDDVAIVAIRRT